MLHHTRTIMVLSATDLKQIKIIIEESCVLCKQRIWCSWRENEWTKEVVMNRVMVRRECCFWMVTAAVRIPLKSSTAIMLC